MTSVLRSQPHISTSSLRIPLLPPLPPSALNPGDHVVEQEEDQDQAHGDVAEDAAVVSAGSHHGGEALHAAAQQTRRTEEVGVHAIQILVLIVSLSVDVVRQRFQPGDFGGQVLSQAFIFLIQQVVHRVVTSIPVRHVVE